MRLSSFVSVTNDRHGINSKPFICLHAPIKLLVYAHKQVARGCWGGRVALQRQNIYLYQRDVE